ncbi:MAG: AraC family transcriptional regulator [Ruminococcaceae bacterium]|nr:AraC family transcriptional regulator [Oscillospiraceae bacterium]
MFFYQAFNSQTGINNDIRIFRNFNFMPHIHRDLELTYVLEGEIDITIESKTYHAKKNDMALVFSNQIHSFSSPKDSRVLIHVFSPDNIRSFVQSLNGRIGKNPIFTCDPTIGEFYYKCLIEKKMRSNLAIKSYLYIIFDQFLASTELVERGKTNDDILHQMLDYITNHFKEDITLKTIAKDLGYEPHYLSRIFGNSTGVNLRNYINQYRIDYAKFRLTESKDPITDIALSCGFGTIRNFNRVFLEHVGVTPLVFRQNTMK